MNDKTNVGFSVHKRVMEKCRVGPTKNNMISKHLKQTYCYPIFYHYGTLYTTTGGNMPYSQSVGVRRNLEDVKLISGSIQ